MKKLLAIGFIIIILCESVTGCNKNDNVSELSNNENIISTGTSLDIHIEGETTFIAEPFNLFKSEEGQQTIFNSGVVMGNYVFLLMSVRDEKEIQRKLDAISPQMSIDQINKIHDEIENEHVREEILVIDNQGKLKGMVDRSSFFGVHSIPILSIHKGEDCIYVISKMFYQESMGVSGNLIQKMSFDGVVSEQMDFISSSRVSDRTNSSYTAFTWDREGNCYAGGDNYNGENVESFIDVWDKDGNILFSLNEGLETKQNAGKYPRVFLVDGNNIYVIVYLDDDRKELVEILPKEQRLGERIELENQSSSVSMQMFDGNLLFTDTVGITRWNLQSKQTDIFLQWSEVDIDDSDVGFIPFVISRDKILTLGQCVSGKEKNNTQINGYILSRVAKEDIITEKTTLVIAGTGIKSNSALKEAIKQFTLENIDFEVEIRDYWDELVIEKGKNPPQTEKENLEFRLDFNMGLIEKGDIDIFIEGEFMDFPALSRSNIFVNMNIFIDNDPEFHKGDYIDLMFHPTNGEGTLLYSFPSFEIVGLCVSKDNAFLTSDENSLDDLDKYLSKQEKDVDAFYPVSPQQLLERLLGANQSEFIEAKGNKANYENEHFYRLLSFCKKYGTVEYNGEYVYEKMLSGQTLMSIDGRSWIGSIDFWASQMMNKTQEKVSIMPYPSKTTSHYVIAPSSLFAIADRPNKQKAWELIKKYIAGTSSGVFSVNKEALESQFNRYYKMADEKGNVAISDYTVSISALKELYSYIQKATKVWQYDNEINSIVVEEAAAYFADQKTVEAVATIIQDRVQTKLNEQG